MANENDIICPECEKGNLVDTYEVQQVQYNGQFGEVVSNFSYCDSCGVEMVNEEQQEVNVANIMAFKLECEDKMPSELILPTGFVK